MIKKLLTAIVCLWAIFIINTHSGLYLVNTYVNSNVVETVATGPIPIEHTFGYIINEDTFYKNFTK